MDCFSLRGHTSALLYFIDADNQVFYLFFIFQTHLLKLTVFFFESHIFFAQFLVSTLDCLEFVNVTCVRDCFQRYFVGSFLLVRLATLS